MPPITYPNQRVVKIHRESVKTDFLGIKNENWQAASRDLGAHGLRLYLYLAANANNYALALSPAAARAAIGIPRSTFFDQFAILVDKRYLVPGVGNTYDFYEVPQAATQTRMMSGVGGQDFTESPSHGEPAHPDGQNVLHEDIEINNTDTQTNGIINNNNPAGIYVPKVREITIPRPKAEGKDRPKPAQEPQKMEFVF